MRFNFYILNNGLISENGMSGSDLRALNWAKEFIKNGHSVVLVVPEIGEKRYGEFERIVTTKGPSRPGMGLFFSYFVRGLKAYKLLSERLLKDGCLNLVVYSSSDLLADSLPAILLKKRFRKIKWIAGLHLLAPDPFKGFKKVAAKGYVFPGLANIYYYFTQRIVIHFMKKYAHTVMVSNSADREFLIKKGFLKERVIVTYGAVDWEDINKSQGTVPLYDACYVGRFHQQKGFGDLIKAWKEVCKVKPNALLAVVGDDINFAKIVESVQSEGLSENIRFLGFLSGADKFNVLKSSKICVFPSTYESFGIVVLEAMACGLPVVAYDLPIYKEIYPGGIFKAKINDFLGLYRGISALLNDELLHKKLSAQAIEISKGFSWGKTAQSILSRLT